VRSSFEQNLYTSGYVSTSGIWIGMRSSGKQLLGILGRWIEILSQGSGIWDTGSELHTQRSWLTVR